MGMIKEQAPQTDEPLKTLPYNSAIQWLPLSTFHLILHPVWSDMKSDWLAISALQSTGLQVKGFKNFKDSLYVLWEGQPCPILQLIESPEGSTNT